MSTRDLRPFTLLQRESAGTNDHGRVRCTIHCVCTLVHVRVCLHVRVWERGMYPVRDRATVRVTLRELADETSVVLEQDRCGPLRVIYARISERPPFKSWRDDTRISGAESDSQSRHSSPSVSPRGDVTR